MFKLKRLEVTGFKSFADYTEVVFTGSGITAVVGPNGCGKSNVSDAISWVLGEQSPKLLRGQEMKDVVFQGTDKRQPGGMAEVILHLERDDSIQSADESELEAIDAKLGEIDEQAVDVDALEAEHLDNEEEAEVSEDAIGEIQEDAVMVQAAQVGSVKTITKKAKRRWKARSFALDFAPGEAVSVTRRLYLSGESEYLLNNKSCRLRDIQDLFAGTGLSGAHYAIIEQGRISRILSSKPSDRRGLIEEAAGISKFKKRQRAAESRLDSAKSNLSRITDIVEEIEKRTRSLRRQANKTKRYKVLKDELLELQSKTYVIEATRLKADLDELGERLTNAGKNEAELRELVLEREKEVKEATTNARVAEESLTELRALHADNALERDRAEREQRYLKEQREELEARIDDLADEFRAVAIRIESLETEISTTKAAAETETEVATKEKERLESADTKYREVLKMVNEIENTLDLQRADHLQHTGAVERLSEIGRQYEVDLERFGDRVKGLEHEKKRAEETLELRREESKEVQELLETEQTKLEKSRKEKQDISKSVDRAREQVNEEQRILTETEQVHSRNKHRLETLKELEETGAIYAPSVQKLMSAGSAVKAKITCTLADKLNTGSADDLAVEALFGSYLQAVVVPTRKDALAVLDYVEANDLGRIPVLAEETNGHSPTSPNPRIVSLLGIDEDFAGVLANAFPQEMGAVVAEDLSSLRGDEPIAVSKKGEVVYSGQLFVAGARKEGAKNNSLLAFKREMRELSKASVKSEAALKKSLAAIETKKAALHKNEEALVDIQSYIVQLEREMLSREIQSTSLIQEIERSERHTKVVVEELKQLTDDTKSIETKRLETSENISSAEEARKQSGALIDQTTAKLAEHRKLLDAENIAYNQMRTTAEVAAERMRAAVSALNRVNAEKSELEARGEKINEEIGNSKARIANFEKQSLQIAERLVKAQQELESESDELAAAVAHLKLARENSDKLSDQLAESNTKAGEARDNRAALEVRDAELKTKLQNVQENCRHDLSIEIGDLVERTEIEDEFEFEEARERVEYLRNRLDNFGAINMLAVEELADTEERLEFLTSQQQDVVDSISAAEAALREIKKRSRDRFRKAFEAINENFREFFSELFGGGTGNMVLLESDDILDAGIEITSQPPGKKLQNMLLLSGGEKAMTAIALVLAIFKYRPSPFCLLDEVDAPLDDANVGRFVDRIDAMSENTQFIVITHNKRTMEAARALYGVTMQEPGVSKIVSVRFD